MKETRCGAWQYLFPANKQYNMPNDYILITNLMH